MRAVENKFGIDARSELCKPCIHTNVCCKDKNTVGDVFGMGHPMFFDNASLYRQFKEREKAGFPCEDYFPVIVKCKDCRFSSDEGKYCEHHRNPTLPDAFCSAGRLKE